MKKQVSIASFTDGLRDYSADVAIVAIDVIRATTTAITALAMGRTCLTVSSVAAALALAAEWSDPLLVGELGGDKPEGFEITNSPAQLARRTDVHRPMILLSSSGTQLIEAIQPRDNSYIACFRNCNSTIDYLAQTHSNVALVGAGSRGEFREEDQMCCAWIAEGLIENGFTPDDKSTRHYVERWRGLPRNSFLGSRSVDYLRRSNQLQDLDFILAHFNDVDTIGRVSGNEIVNAAVPVATVTL